MLVLCLLRIKDAMNAKLCSFKFQNCTAEIGTNMYVVTGGDLEYESFCIKT